MFLRKVEGPRVVALPGGRHITLADLPPPNTLRWVAQRKRAVAEAVQAGLISRGRARDIYALSDDELDAWCALFPLQNANTAAR